MKILLCSVPDGSLESTLEPLFSYGNQWGRNAPPILPVGILRINTWIEKNGYNSDIYDLNNLRPSDEQLIKNFKQVKPTVVALSAPFSHCYPNVKRISKILRELFPDIWIILGGSLTGSSNVALYKTETDICVVGDGEIPFLKLLDYFKLHPTRRQIDFTGLNQIKGLAFIDKNNKLKVTGNAEQLPASELIFHDLDRQRLGLQKFGGNGELIHEFFPPMEAKEAYWPKKWLSSPEGLKFLEKNINKTIAAIPTTRGCVARCTFCQRYTKGYRVYAPNHFESHIMELKEKYNVGGLWIWDENFGSNKKQCYEIARIMKKHDIFWMADAARCTSVTYEDLKFYKEHNCVWLAFGIESGSQKMLDIMEKKFTTEDIYNAYSNCKKVGLLTFFQSFMFGMPGETRETIIESAQFAASLQYLAKDDWNVLDKPALAWAIPGTPLYEYSQQIGAIGKTLEEEEDYLIRVAELKSSLILGYLNKTDSNIKEVHYWKYLYPFAQKKAYVGLIIKNNQSIKNRLLQIYEKCIKGALNGLISDFYQRKNFNKNKQLLHKMKWLTLIFINFLLSLGVLFLPKAILFPIIRVYADLRFYVLKKNNKVKKGKQKYNFFMSKPVDFTNNFRLTESEIAKVNRPIERSLRKIVMDNRKQIKPATTYEEKGLQILAEGQ